MGSIPPKTGVILDSRTGLKGPKVSSLTALGRDHICGLGVTEGSKTSIDILSPDCKVVFAARHELCQCTCHGQRQRLHLPDLLPLRGHGGTGVLVVGIQVVTVHGGTAPVYLHHTPRQHNPILALYPGQLQLWLLRWRSVGSFGGQTWWLWCLWKWSGMYGAWWLLSSTRAIRENQNLQQWKEPLIHHSPGNWKQMSLQSHSHLNSQSCVHGQGSSCKWWERVGARMP